MARVIRDSKNVLRPLSETHILLKDGTSMLLRPISNSDKDSWQRFLSRLSENDKYLRFQHISRDMNFEDALTRFCCTEHCDVCAVIAEVFSNSHKDIVAVGKYYRLPDTHSAEVILAVDDGYKGRGLGTAILEELMNIARPSGIDTFRADVLACDMAALSIFKDYGFKLTRELHDDTYRVTFPITETAVIQEKEDERERISTLASLHSLLMPKSIALIGASRHPGELGYILLESLIKNGFTGQIYPVNPNADSILSLKSYPSVSDVNDNIEMAVIAVPARLAVKVAEECGHKGVRTLVVISDGFSETGPEGASREKELRDVVLGHGMRMLGPNCMGVINTDPQIKMNATFSSVFPPFGNVAFLSQSGAMGLIVLQYAKNLDIGISSFVSAGNRADISSNDLLEFWEEDPATSVVLLYLESFGNPHKFAHIARRVAQKKPVVVIKGGSTKAGSRAAASHTGAMATSDVLTDVLFRRAGMIRVNLMEEMFNVAALLSNQPLPKGRDIVIVTNGGGPGILAADAASRNGFNLPQPSKELAEKIKNALGREINIRNPIDTTAGAGAKEFCQILRLLAAEKKGDAVLAIFIPPVIGNVQDYEDTIRDVAGEFSKHKKPLLACFLGQRGLKARLGTANKSVPSFPFPEEAIAALARAVEYAETLKRPVGKIIQFKDIQRDRAREIIALSLTRSAQRPMFMEPGEIADLVACYGINLTPAEAAGTADEAAEIASRIGFPVAVKLDSKTITHKSDVGGVMLDINSVDDVKKAFNYISDRLKKIGRQDEMQGVVVQKMIKGGIEAIAGVTHDPEFGPLIMFGSGGIYTELLKDNVMMLPPLTDVDAKEMISSIKLSRLFEGFRGEPPSDIEAIQEMLLRLSAMVEDISQINELDFNPIKVMPRGDGYYIVDARVMLS